MLSVGSFSAVLGKLVKMQIPRSSLQLDKQPGIWSLVFFFAPLFKSLLNLLQYCFCFMFWFLILRHV